MHDQQLQLRLFDFPALDEPAPGDALPSPAPAAPPAPPKQAALPLSPADLPADTPAAPAAQAQAPAPHDHKVARANGELSVPETPSHRALEAGGEEIEPAEGARTNGHNPPGPGAEASPRGGVIMVGGIPFHHSSEAEFARLLNYYGIEWQYEPHQFPLQWRDGRPTEMFAPDFYLTEYDLYIELTTMRQSLVRRKNRKLRVLRALYPDINIKLLYRRDYHRLLERFGIRAEEIDAEMPPNSAEDAEE
jgi:hypothetical protein